jgi:hypothetical protein
MPSISSRRQPKLDALRKLKALDPVDPGGRSTGPVSSALESLE